MAWVILDTNVYIGHWETGLYEDTLAAVRRAFVVRHSAVVLSELRRGARTRRSQRLVEDLYRLAKVAAGERLVAGSGIDSESR